MATKKVQLLPFNSCLNRCNRKISSAPCFSSKFTYELIPGWSNKLISLSLSLSLYFPFWSYLVTFSVSSCHTVTRRLRCPPRPTALPHDHSSAGNAGPASQPTAASKTHHLSSSTASMHWKTPPAALPDKKASQPGKGGGGRAHWLF